MGKNVYRLITHRQLGEGVPLHRKPVHLRVPRVGVGEHKVRGTIGYDEHIAGLAEPRRGLHRRAHHHPQQGYNARVHARAFVSATLAVRHEQVPCTCIKEASKCE